jgi:hypothetical protein
MISGTPHQPHCKVLPTSLAATLFEWCRYHLLQEVFFGYNSISMSVEASPRQGLHILAHLITGFANTN